MRLIAAACGILAVASAAQAGAREPGVAMTAQAQAPAPSPPDVAAPETPEPAEGQPPAPDAVPGQPDARTGAATAASAARVFASESGMIFNAIRPDKVVDFEFVLGRLKQALATSTDPVRQKQAAGWRIFRAAEPGPNGSVLYVFVMDPAVKGADYGVARILSESFPDEVLDLYKLYNGAFSAGQTMLNLTSAPTQTPGSKPAPAEAKPAQPTGTTPAAPPAATPATPPETTPPSAGAK